MTPGARIQAAIDILADIAANPRPADKAVREWGTGHRFAGSKDRAAIRSLVFAAFRHRGEALDILGADDPRTVVLVGACRGLGESAESLATMLTGEGYAAAALSGDERAGLARLAQEAARGPFWPAWLEQKITARFGAAAEELMRRLDGAAPLDLRVNPEIINRGAALAALKGVGFPAVAGTLSPLGIRIPRGDDLTGANIRALPMFKDGAVEIQDEGSQLVALMAGAAPGMQVIDLCAGGGGKTIALGAQMRRSGQIYACDIDETRLRAGQERVARAGLHNVQPRLIAPWTPQEGVSDPDLADLEGKADLVFLDVPCTGSGAWRRQPDAKWRLTEDRLADYLDRQSAILDRGRRLVGLGGRLVYVTCSVLPEENERQIEAFLERTRGFEVLDGGAAFAAIAGRAPPAECRVAIGSGTALQLGPVTTDTDGFFFAALEKTT